MPHAHENLNNMTLLLVPLIPLRNEEVG
jgi:hypothetical protein